jgi:hypothetical protein
LRDDLPKSQKRRIRELSALTHERELAREPGAIETGFNAFELTDLIHKFHDGPSRELNSIYTSSDTTFVVGSAIARGILSVDEVTPEIMELLAGQIQIGRDDLD